MERDRRKAPQEKCRAEPRERWQTDHAGRRDLSTRCTGL